MGLFSKSNGNRFVGDRRRDREAVKQSFREVSGREQRAGPAKPRAMQSARLALAASNPGISTSAVEVSLPATPAKARPLAAKTRGAARPVSKNRAADANREAPAAFPWAQRLREATGFLSLAAAALVLLSLVSTGREAGNWVGPVGRGLSHGLLAALGASAFLMVPALVMVGLALLEVTAGKTRWLESAGTASVVFWAATLAHLIHGEGVLWGHPIGGAVGGWVGQGLAASLSTPGAVVVSFAVGVLSLILACGVSIQAAVAAVVRFVQVLSTSGVKGAWALLMGTAKVGARVGAEGGQAAAEAWRGYRERTAAQREVKAAEARVAREERRAEQRRAVSEMEARAELLRSRTGMEAAEGLAHAAAQATFTPDMLVAKHPVLVPSVTPVATSAPGGSPDPAAFEPVARLVAPAPTPPETNDLVSTPPWSVPTEAPEHADDIRAPVGPIIVGATNHSFDDSADTSPEALARRASLAGTGTVAPPTRVAPPHVALPNTPLIVDAAAEAKKRERVVVLGDRTGEGGWHLPETAMLEYHRSGNAEQQAVDDAKLQEKLTRTAAKLKQVLESYGVQGNVREIRRGPVVTVYEYSPDAGVKSAKVTGLSNDLALQLSVYSVRVVPNIPGKGVMGIEVPNETRELVSLREVVESGTFADAVSKVSMAFGKDIEGAPFVQDLAKMPHLLVAGATGTGKSVAINTMLMSVLMNATPDEVRLLLVDPKHVEFQMYEDIPHLLLPVVTDPKQALNALLWACEEMDRRYKLLAAERCRNLAGYNAKVEAHLANDTWRTMKDHEGNFIIQPPKKLPLIVVVIDELAELLMVAKEVEIAIARLAQKARASGMHLIIATQKPSTDVISGVIKANLPTRVSFRVSAGYESKVILDSTGAEQLLGRGDMLFRTESQGIVRVQGSYVSDEEVERVVAYWRQQGEPEYDDSILEPRAGDDGAEADQSDMDPLYHEAVRLVRDEGKVSISWIQRKLAIGYQRSARIVEMMELQGVVSPADHKGKRDVIG
jgi:DNA segregation ATPase FtsK/SpoIIIE, S-DNA-T family